jgi:hypothetical protein
MKAVHDATLYLKTHGWGTSGIGRLLSETDLPLIRHREAVVGKRPRGILSGFLVVVPGGPTAWIPPALNSVIPVRMRLREDLRLGGCIASAYAHEGEYVVEDMLVWKDEPVFYCKAFPERWAHVREFFGALKHDTVLQGGRLRAATYWLPSAIIVPDAHSVVEWVPYAPHQKRLIYVSERVPQVRPEKAVRPVLSERAERTERAEKTERTVAVRKVEPIHEVVARKDLAGPDVFQLWRGTSHLGQALVRTLAVSKALRTFSPDNQDIPVTVELNKAFSKWEITGVKNRAP